MEESSSRIEELKKQLYAREDPHFSAPRSRFSPEHINPDTAWQSTNDMPKKELVSFSFLKRVLIASIIFFIGVVSFSAYVFLGGTNVVSADKIDIVINGPVSVKGGDPLVLDIKVKNNNNVALQDTNLIIKYPNGTRSADDYSRDQLSYQKFQGELVSGGGFTETVKAVLFGAEQSTQKILVTLEYRVPGSHAIYPKTKEFNILLTSAPVGIKTTFPKEVNANEEVEIVVDLNSNSPNVLRDVLLNVAYPSGFIFRSATPEPSYGNNIWDIGDLSVSGARKFVIRGVMEGQNEELKAFRVTAGIKNLDNEREISVPYITTFDTLTIKRAFVDVAFKLNGSDSQFVPSNTGERVRGDITLTSNLPDQVRDAEVTVQVSGPFVPSTVSPSRGFFRSKDSTIVWTKLEQSQLASIDPGEVLPLNFNLGMYSVLQLRTAGIQNPEITFKLTFKGKRITDGSQSETFETNIIRSVRINAIASVEAKGLHNTGPISNSGPIPPRVDQDTTYTVTMNMGTTLNDLSDGVITATLPSYVRYLGVTVPSSADIVFNKDNNQIQWNVGSVRVGREPEEVSFQIAFQPSITQAEDYPNLVTNIKYSVRDAFTNTPISGALPAISTRLTSEPGFTDSMGKVAR